MGVHLAKNKGGHIYLESPKEQLMKMLVEKTLSVGHMLSFREACEDPDLIDPNNYAFYYGSFSEAARIAWAKASKPQSEENTTVSGEAVIIPNSQKPLSKASNPKPHNYTNPDVDEGAVLMDRSSQTDEELYLDDDGGNLEQIDTCQVSKEQTDKPRSRTRKFTREMIKKQIVDFYREHGRLPKQAEVTSDPDMPCWTTLYRVLGNRNEWYRMVQAELQKESSSQLYDSDKSTLQEDAISEEEVPPTSPTIPNNKPSAIASDIKPVINTKYNWEGDYLHVEVRVVKPGNTRPVYITLLV